MLSSRSLLKRSPCSRDLDQVLVLPIYIGSKIGFTPYSPNLKCKYTCQVAEKESNLATMSIDNLDKEYCDDFECTSSPAIEHTVRSVARDIQRRRYTRSIFQTDVEFEDGFRKVKGIEKCLRKPWVNENVKNAAVTMAKVEMVSRDTARLLWSLTGNVSGFPITIAFETTVTMHLLTGRITSYKEKWDLSKTSPLAAAAVTFNRLLWSLAQTSKDANESLNKASDSLLSSFEEDQSVKQTNATDPTRFFFQNDNNMGDYISFATVAALLYLTFKVFAELENIK